MDYDLKRIPRFPDPIEEEEELENKLLYYSILRLHNLLTVEYKLLLSEDKKIYIKKLRETYWTLFNKLKLSNYQIEKIEKFILRNKTHILISKLSSKSIKL